MTLPARSRPTAHRDPQAVLTRDAAGPDVVLRYGEHRDHLVDVYLPVQTPAPLLVLWHGGFWRAEHDRRHIRPLAVSLREQGYAVAIPEYRRTSNDSGDSDRPDVTGSAWPPTFDDVARVRSELPALLSGALPDLVAPAPPVVVGHSAGGQLALWWAVTAAAADTAGVVALAPVADLARAYADDLGGGAVRALLGGSPTQHPERYAVVDTAALLTDWSGRAPVVVHGDRDQQVPIAHSRGLVGVDLIELPATEHFALIDPLSAAWPHVLAAVRSRSAPPW